MLMDIMDNNSIFKVQGYKLFINIIVSSVLLVSIICLYAVTPYYDISQDPPINGYCIGDQIVVKRECINPTCLDGYNLDSGTCIESKPYSNLVPYSDMFCVFLYLGAIYYFCLILFIVGYCIDSGRPQRLIKYLSRDTEIVPPTQSIDPENPENPPVYFRDTEIVPPTQSIDPENPPLYFLYTVAGIPMVKCWQLKN
jgi:hypothetical protein